MLKLLAVLTCGVGLLAGCTSGPSGPDTRGKRTREERVSAHFGGLAPDIAKKESMPSPPQINYLMVDEDRTDDGRVRSLWTTVADGMLSRCFYLDTESAGGASGFGGCGGGPDQKRYVSLGGAAGDGEADLFGDVGSWPATGVRITAAGGLEATVPIKNGYFLVPVRITKSGARTFDVSLLDESQKVIEEVTGVKAPQRH